MQEFLLVASVHLLAVMSPGPDFAMVLRNSLVYSRRTGILAAVGLALGILLHVTYSLLGIGLIISQSIVLFNFIKILGAVYLIYIGMKSLLFAKKETRAEIEQEIKDEFSVSEKKKDLSTFAAVRMGFLTNALNPKATLFFLALFTQVISPDTVFAVKALYGIEMALATFVWFAFVAVILTNRRVSSLFSGIKHHIERVFGVILIALGVKVAMSSSK